MDALIEILGIFPKLLKPLPGIEYYNPPFENKPSPDKPKYKQLYIYSQHIHTKHLPEVASFGIPGWAVVEITHKESVIAETPLIINVSFPMF